MTMPASSKTADQILEVLKEFVPDPAARRNVTRALADRVGGNKSVRATLASLAEKAEEEYVQKGGAW
jgi:hypothetical protein